MSEQFDVIVVGGGGSGLAAAVSAAENGASVLLLEKQPTLGGTTAIAVGSFTANRTRLQQTAGLTDSVADHAEDAGKFAPAEIEAHNNAELRHFFLEHSADTLHWLIDLGIHFHGPSPEPPNRTARMHNVVPSARAYIDTLSRRLLQLGGAIRTGSAVRELIRDHDGVHGVVAQEADATTRYVARRGVILAAGDYANSPALIDRFKGREFAEIDGINVNATGDGHLLAEAAGARLVNMDITYGPEIRFIPPRRPALLQRLPTRGPLAALARFCSRLAPQVVVSSLARRMLVTWQHPETLLFDHGAILLNLDGQRFCDETATPARELAIARQPEKSAFILLDEQLIDQFNMWPNFISTAPEIAYAYVDDYLRLRRDVAVAGNSLAEIAARRGLSASKLETTVREYNDTAAAQGQRPLAGNRWVLLGPARSYFTTTEGGAAIDRHFRALDDGGQPIPGLYAVGQNGLGGQILWGHGLHIGWAITSGRLAGREVAGQHPRPSR